METGEISKFCCTPYWNNNRPEFFFGLLRMCFVCFLKVVFCFCLWISFHSTFQRNIQQIFFEDYHGLDAFIYVFISLNSPSYTMKWILSLVYRQSVVRLSISLSKNILLPMKGKNRIGTGTFCLYSFQLVAQLLLLL